MAKACLNIGGLGVTGRRRPGGCSQIFQVLLGLGQMQGNDQG